MPDFEVSLEFGNPDPILGDEFTYVTKFLLETSIFSSDPAQILRSYFLPDKNNYTKKTLPKYCLLYRQASYEL